MFGRGQNILNTINNNSENFRGGKIAARVGEGLIPP